MALFFIKMQIIEKHYRKKRVLRVCAIVIAFQILIRNTHCFHIWCRYKKGYTNRKKVHVLYLYMFRCLDRYFGVDMHWVALKWETCFLEVFISSSMYNEVWLIDYLEDRICIWYHFFYKALTILDHNNKSHIQMATLKCTRDITYK